MARMQCLNKLPADLQYLHQCKHRRERSEQLNLFLFLELSEDAFIRVCKSTAKERQINNNKAIQCAGE